MIKNNNENLEKKICWNIFKNIPKTIIKTSMKKVKNYKKNIRIQTNFYLNLYNKALRSYIAIAGQTAGPKELIFFKRTPGYPGVTYGLIFFFKSKCFSFSKIVYF